MENMLGIWIPFFGTALGAACVFFLKHKISSMAENILLGISSGIMTAASVWSLLIPAISQSQDMGKFAFLPASIGFLSGMIVMLLLNRVISCIEPVKMKMCEVSNAAKWKKTVLLVLAITIHNIPEGMAVGVVFAGLLTKNADITYAGAFALAVGIAIQNFPEGAIVSLPLSAEMKVKKGKAFLIGVLSGIVEPVAAGGTLLLFSQVESVLPYLLAFAAGAMIYVVVEELIPETSQGQYKSVGTIAYAVGFVIMMILDVAFG